ncbi:reverse transcriptase domain-containing protein [Tanacetum coccineum]
MPKVLGLRRLKQGKVKIRGANLPPSLAAHLGRNENSQPLRSSLTSVQGGHQPSTNMGGNLPPNDTLLLHHAQPFIPSSLHIPTGLVPTPVNPYSQPPMNLVHGQALNFLFQTQMGNPPAGGASTYQGGYIPQAFTNNSVPSYNGPIHPTVTPSSSYPFYAQPMYAPPNMPAYPNPAGPFADSAGSVTPFVHWIKDYPLSDGLKMPSHIGSYDGKGDPDNFLHLFEGAIRMQKWLMPVACHMFTYTLKDSARIWWNSQKTGSILNYEDLKAKFRSHFSQQKKFTKTHLAVHNIKQREGESTPAFITRYMDDTLQILGLLIGTDKTKITRNRQKRANTDTRTEKRARAGSQSQKVKLWSTQVKQSKSTLEDKDPKVTILVPQVSKITQMIPKS